MFLQSKPLGIFCIVNLLLVLVLQTMAQSLHCKTVHLTQEFHDALNILLPLMSIKELNNISFLKL